MFLWQEDLNDLKCSYNFSFRLLSLLSCFDFTEKIEKLQPERFSCGDKLPQCFGSHEFGISEPGVSFSSTMFIKRIPPSLDHFSRTGLPVHFVRYFPCGSERRKSGSVAEPGQIETMKQIIGRLFVSESVLSPAEGLMIRPSANLLFQS